MSATTSENLVEGISSDAQECCPSEETDSSAFLMTSSSSDLIRHRPPFSRTYSVPALTHLIEDLTVKQYGGVKCFQDRASQACSKEAPHSETLNKLNVMMRRLQMIHCQILEESTLCGALERCGDVLERCGDGPSVGVRMSETEVDEIHCVGPRDKATQIMASNRQTFIDVSLITHLLETYERCHQAILQDLRGCLDHMDTLVSKTEKEESTQPPVEEPQPEDSTDQRPPRISWWRRLICIG